MYKAPPKFIYIRWIGLICTLVPMLALLLITFYSSGYQGIVFTFASFIPLLILSYYLDVIIMVIPFPNRIRHPYLQVSLSWLLSYPLARLVGTEPVLIAFGYPTLAFGDITSVALILVGLAFLGFAYGTFFYTAYITLFRFYLKRRVKRGEIPEGF